MPDVDADNYLRLVLLIIDIGSCLLRDVLLLERGKRKRLLSDLLEDNKLRVEQNRKHRIITEEQFNILYPDGNDRPDIGTWDISLLTYVVILLFETYLDPGVCTAVENIRDHRNFVAHSSSATVDVVTYINKECSFKRDLQILVSQLESTSQHEYSSRIHQCSTRVFFQSDMGNVQALCKKEDMLDQFKKLTSKHLTDMEQRIISKLTEEIQRHTEPVDIPRICLILEIEGEDRVNNHDAFKLLLKLFTAAKHKAETPSCYEDVYREALGILNDLDEIGAKTEDVTSKCLMLTLRCSSLKDLLNLIKPLPYGSIRMKFKNLLKIIIGEDINFKLYISPSSLTDICEYLGIGADFRQVKMQLSISDPSTVASLIDMIYSEKANSALSNLSASLSKAVRYPLSIGARLEINENSKIFYRRRKLPLKGSANGGLGFKGRR